MIITSFIIFRKRFVPIQTALFLLTALALTNCKRDGVLGLELQPDGEFDSIQSIDSFTVNSFTLLGRRQRSDEAQSYVGRLSTPEFGITTSNLVFNVGFDRSNALDTGDYQYVSLTLNLEPRGVYGDHQSSLPIQVFELDETVAADQDYFSDTTIAFLPTPVGSVNVATPHPDSLQPISISLSDDLGERLFENIPNYETTSELETYLKGLMLAVDSTKFNGTGSIYGLSMTDAGSNLTLRVYDVAADTLIDLVYPINATNARFNLFHHNYSGSIAKDYLDDSLNTHHDRIFVQGMAGLRSEIQIPHLFNFGRINQLAINKATLTFQLSPDQPNVLGSSRRLYLLDLEEDGVESLTLDYITNATRHDGDYNSKDKTFAFDVTRHIQKIMLAAGNEQDINYGLRLHAQVPVINGNDTSHNVILGSDNIVLKVFYTDIKN